jgi:tRNA threonylcarbamoyl adenosine modification protein (Sua5/YciO/YrdC/YwlC family)
MRQTRILSVQPENRAESVRQATDALKRGSLVIVPTDTVYGVAADPRACGAEERLFEAKGRDKTKPVALLAASLADIEKYGAILTELDIRLASMFWPGPLTLVLTVGERTEGFRIPDFEPALMLLREVGNVLRVTSANLSGQPPALTAGDAVRAIGAFVAVALDAGPSPGGTPSTVARVENERLRILREGAIKRETLEKECRIVL